MILNSKMRRDTNKNLTCALSFAELTIEFRYGDVPAKNETRFLFSLLPFQEQEKSNNPAKIILNLEVASKPLDTSGCDFQSTNDYGLFFHHGTGQTVITDKLSLFVVGHGSGKAGIYFHPSFFEKSPLDKSNFYLLGLIHLFAQYGYFDLHGAGVINNGRGYLILGPSGSGKSSLALSLVNQGWGYASDDALLLDTNKSELIVHSFRKNFYVDFQLVKQFPELKNLMRMHNSKESDKFFFNPEDIRPGRFHPQFVPEKIVFCAVTGRKTSTIQEIYKKDALLRLLPQSASVFFNRLYAQKQIDALQRLVRQTKCYQLDAGLDLYNNPEKAAELLEKVS